MHTRETDKHTHTQIHMDARTLREYPAINVPGFGVAAGGISVGLGITTGGVGITTGGVGVTTGGVGITTGGVAVAAIGVGVTEMVTENNNFS